MVSKGLMKVLERRGWQLDQSCLSFIGYEGGKAHVARQKAIVKEIVGKHGGIVLGKGPGVLYDQKKFDTPYIRDFLLDRGAIGDVSETAAPWSKLKPLYDNVMAAANRAYAELGVHGWIMCHLSHSYHSGACLYFTFAFRHDGVDPLAQYDKVKSAVQQAFVDSEDAVAPPRGGHRARALAGAGHLRARRTHDRRAVLGDGPRRQLQPGQDRRQVAGAALGNAGAGQRKRVDLWLGQGS